MSAKLKAMLLDQAVNQALTKEYPIKSIKSTHVSYQHAQNVYIVKMNSRPESLNILKSDVNSEEALTFRIDRNLVIKNVLDSIKQNEYDITSNPKKVVIDFSSPNIAKPFHMGHMRSTVIGNFIANINTHFRNQVTKINYLGDWGTQFGLLQYGLKLKNIDVNTLKNNPLQTLYNIYVEANKLAEKDKNIQIDAVKYFAEIESGKMDLQNWKQIKEITVKELEKLYLRLRIKFDLFEWESDYNSQAIRHIIKELEDANIVTTHESGKKIAYVNNRKVTLVKSDDSSLYLTRDIAALLNRYETHKFDKMLYVVDNAQADHFVSLFDIMKRLNKKCATACEHVKFGRIRGMSTRRGNVVFLNDILDEAKTKMYDQQLQSKNTRTSAMNDETCDILGSTAVIINDLKQRRQKDYEFSWDKALQSEGDSGVKLQYLHCRLKSLENNSEVPVPDFCNPECLPEEIIGDVIAELARFDDILKKAYEENEACILVNYLFRLSRYVNKMFNKIIVKGESNDVASQRLLVFYCARQVLKTSLNILGIKPLYEM
ncbi:probable arginine--tRNA ligase, mitochondrial [Leptidea sinapis]|uniref:Probable arginine--tRNA ligase, mitochondrial n=1 Tax=Leptidea sinapis TaxID=189913 RepID=A0A5E4Q3Z8_9NEOP|nr:probable arginine--tRNA ligase, mitochondrial [Leptidea sinapis]VVC92264.1 unnamed protein product [Leptidea sinapis]